MDATAPGRLSRSWWRLRPGPLVMLVLAAVLAQGCSDNSGRATPTSATSTGDGIGGPGSVSLFAQVTVNPGTVDRGRRASVLVIVTNANGFPLAGRNVQLTTSLGRLDQTAGTTGADGLFSTTLFVPCEATANATGNVIAIVEGVTSGAGGAFTAVTSATEDPCA